MLKIDSKIVLDKLIYLTDQKIDVLEHLVEKLETLNDDEKTSFIQRSVIIERLDVLNIEFLEQYDSFMRLERISAISEVSVKHNEKLKLLKTLVEYAYDLDVILDGILKRL